MATSNSINANSTGLVRYNGTGTFDAVTTTNHDVLIGASSNGITNVAPSATSGVPLISQGASSDPVFGTAAIAGGGTNATSMSTSTGIVKYDGTRLVTSSTALIDSSNRYTNTAQPCFHASLTSGGANVTGQSSVYTVIFNNVEYDQTSSYNNATGLFVSPIDGRYLFCANVLFNGIVAANNITQLYFLVDGSTQQWGFNAGCNNMQASGGQLGMSISAVINLGATHFIGVALAVYGNGAANISMIPGNTATFYNSFSGVLLC